MAAGTGPRRTLLAVGHAGWAPGQLEREIEEGYWFTAPADDALVFDADHATKWERATARRRINL
jgi:putative transcriptional regulator